jgi:hypothetical protein
VNTLRLLSTLLLLTASAAAQAAGNITATYAMFQNGQHVGDVTEKFTRKGKTYRIESVTEAQGVFALFAKGAIRMVSSGEIDKNGLKPLHFEYHRGNDATKVASADFDWKANTLTLKSDGKTETLPLEPGTQDRISQNYQFMFVPQPALNITFPVTDGRSVDPQQYQLLGEEATETSDGKLKALRYSRVHQPNERAVDVWLASQRGYFPVRITILEGEKSKQEQVLTKFASH